MEDDGRQLKRQRLAAEMEENGGRIEENLVVEEEMDGNNDGVLKIHEQDMENPVAGEEIDRNHGQLVENEAVQEVDDILNLQNMDAEAGRMYINISCWINTGVVKAHINAREFDCGEEARRFEIQAKHLAMVLEMIWRFHEREVDVPDHWVLSLAEYYVKDPPSRPFPTPFYSDTFTGLIPITLANYCASICVYLN